MVSDGGEWQSSDSVFQIAHSRRDLDPRRGAIDLRRRRRRRAESSRLQLYLQFVRVVYLVLRKSLSELFPGGCHRRSRRTDSTLFY